MLEYLLARTGARTANLDGQPTGSVTDSRELARLVIGYTHMTNPVGVLAAQVSAGHSEPEELIKPMAKVVEDDTGELDSYCRAVATIAIYRYLHKPLPTMRGRLRHAEQVVARKNQRKERPVRSDSCPRCSGTGQLPNGSRCNARSCQGGRLRPLLPELAAMALVLEVPAGSFRDEQLLQDVVKAEAWLHAERNEADSVAAGHYRNQRDDR